MRPGDIASCTGRPSFGLAQWPVPGERDFGFEGRFEICFGFLKWLSNTCCLVSPLSPSAARG